MLSPTSAPSLTEANPPYSSVFQDILNGFYIRLLPDTIISDVVQSGHLSFVSQYHHSFSAEFGLPSSFDFEITPLQRETTNKNNMEPFNSMNVSYLSNMKQYRA